MWIKYCLLLFLIIHQVINDQKTQKKRNKRNLIFTPASQFGVFATVSVPLHPLSTVSVAWFFEAAYYNVDNTTYFDPLLGDVIISRQKEKRSSEESEPFLTRRLFYEMTESMLEKNGYPRQCLRRAICENGASHFLHNGVLGDLLHLALTPSTSLSEEDLDDSYYEAEYLGLQNHCEYYHPDCPYSPLDLISLNVEDFLHTNNV